MPGILHHVGQKLAEQRGVHQVDLVIPVPHRGGLLAVAAGKAVQRVGQKTDRQTHDVGEAAARLPRHVVGAEHRDALGDVLGKIADPLEIVGDPQHADHLAQIHRHRLAHRDGGDALLLDAVLKRVQRRVGAHDLFGPILVVAHQRVDRGQQLLLDVAAHLGDHALELPQIEIECFGGVLGRRQGHDQFPATRSRRAAYMDISCGCEE